MPCSKSATISLLDNWVLVLQQLLLNWLYNFRRSSKSKLGVLLPHPPGWICVFFCYVISASSLIFPVTSLLFTLLFLLHIFYSFFSFYLKSQFCPLHLMLQLLMLTANVLLCYHMWPMSWWKKKPRRSQMFSYLTPPSGCKASLRLRFFLTIPFLFWKFWSSCCVRHNRSRDNTCFPFTCIFLCFERMAF